MPIIGPPVLVTLREVSLYCLLIQFLPTGTVSNAPIVLSRATPGIESKKRINGSLEELPEPDKIVETSNRSWNRIYNTEAFDLPKILIMRSNTINLRKFHRGDNDTISPSKTFR